MGVMPFVQVLVLLAAGLAGDPPEEPGVAEEPGAPLVAYPHPLITEILYAVPTDDGTGRGDANRDGVRDATGDEFIELVNPHDRPIQLRGYTLTDRNRPGRGQFRFVFPTLTLEPGQVAVVFNGYRARWEGPVGDTNRAPPAPHPWFEDAYVFTARVGVAYIALTNDADFVLLSDPGGRPVHAVVWGSPEPAPPPGAGLIERVEVVRGAAVQRRSPGSPLESHILIDGLRYSPGRAFPEVPEEPDAADPPG